MGRPRIHQVHEAELPHVAQPLHHPRVEQPAGEVVDADVVPERVANEGHQECAPSKPVCYPLGPAARIFAETSPPNFLMFSRNIPASFCACVSYAAASFQVSLASSTSGGTP